MQRETLFERTEEAGARLRPRSSTWRQGTTASARRGLLIGVEFVAGRETRQPFPKGAGFTAKVARGMRQRGVIRSSGVPLANFGKDGDHIQISPPFVIADAEIGIIAEALDAAVAEAVRCL